MYQPCYVHDEYVDLEDAEREHAYNLGVEISRYSKRNELHDKRASDQYVNGVYVDGDRVHGLGEVCGCAIAKHLSLEFINSLNSFKNADLPHNIEARLIGNNRYGLRVKVDDDDTRRVVGVVIHPGKERQPYRIPGWINAKHGKKARWLRDPKDQKKPIFLVPQCKLRSLDLLREEIRKDIQKKNGKSPQ
jgi:hypothetical protein